MKLSSPAGRHVRPPGRGLTPRKDRAADAAKGEKMTEAKKPKGAGGRPRKLGAEPGKPISFRLVESDRLAYLAKCEAAGAS